MTTCAESLVCHPPHRVEEGSPAEAQSAKAGRAVLDSERDRIFGEWWRATKGSCSKWSTRMRSNMPTARISFRKSPSRSGARWMRSAANLLSPHGCTALP